MPTNPRSRQITAPVKRSAPWFFTILAGVALLAATAVLPLSARVQETLEFPANHTAVIDADTIAYGSVRIRLKGVAAPERGHREYGHGRDFLIELLQNAQKVKCQLTGELTHGRRVGRCYLYGKSGVQTDMQSSVISAGYARSCIKYGGWRYLMDETEKSRRLPFPGYCFGFSIW